jgi:hypothetical protein
MRNCIVVALALALVAGVTQVGSAAEPGRKLSKGALANLGLGGARAMSDAEGLEVRGMSIAIVMGVGASSVIYTDADPSVASSVESTAYGAVDTGTGGGFGISIGRRLRAQGENSGAAEIAAGDPPTLIIGAYHGGNSVARVGRVGIYFTGP